eukprot:CAMPEP_0115846542 /NCGR_PEP_ID=MMETSP0287-20121206/9914_1 /TAXON_ID=412157 /ORGANISM="Chrysochromulina rotalis, Strain UIO044" /LENGTH=320 /DNA_ID=CAMNT_0003300335 /DNA_START=78 /DNA_END=1040 /DNA_ORIENTATION=+
MNPNYGAETGGYFSTAIKVPHGEHGMHTTSMVLHVPRGVHSAVPEVPPGWSVNVTKYDLLPEDRYTSHGRMVTTAPDKIFYQALTPEAALNNDHLMMINIQLKIGCNFHDMVQSDYSGSNSIWQAQHTLWFKMEQHSSVDNSLVTSATSLWTAALMDAPDGASPGWNPPSSSGLKACPYVFIYAGSRCAIDHSGEAVTGGMTWEGTYVPPAENRGEVLHVQHVLELANEAALSAQEGLEDTYTEKHVVESLTARVQSLEGDEDKNLTIALIALALGALLLGLFTGLCIFRVTAKASFARVISAVPLMTEHKGVTMTSNGV